VECCGAVYHKAPTTEATLSSETVPNSDEGMCLGAFPTSTTDDNTSSGSLLLHHAWNHMESNLLQVTVPPQFSDTRTMAQEATVTAPPEVHLSVVVLLDKLVIPV
jgi:hypothetical protein